MIRAGFSAMVALSLSFPAFAAEPAVAPPAAVAEGKTVIDQTTGMEFVFVNGGCYQMGSNNIDNTKPVHPVCVSAFSMGKTEVTQAQWAKVMGNNPSRFKQCGPECPVEYVSWNEAQHFIKKLNSLSGKQYRMPTEAEWEYAARSGGKNEQWAGTNDQKQLNSFAWYKDNSGETTHKVALKMPNGLGLYDMTGNVDEWCRDWYHEAYNASPKDNPSGPGNGKERVLRGGSWVGTVDEARAAMRYSYTPDDRYDYAGLRLVLPAR